MRIYTSRIPRKNGALVKLGGWIRRIRDLGKVKFLILADREGEVQITSKEDEVPAEVLTKIKKLTKESVVLIDGTVRLSREAPGGLEIVPKQIEILSKAATPLPLDISGKIRSKLDTRLDWRSIDLRNPEVMAIFKIQAKLVEGMVKWLRKNDFIQVFTPCIIEAISEGGADVFPIVYFKREAFLRQDPQLHRQLIIAAGFDRIYDLGPSWRAEPSHTTRHLCEHRGCAVELAFIEDEQDTMRVEEGLVVAALKLVKKDCARELKLLGKKITIPKTPFPELRFPKIYDILAELGKKIPFEEELDREAQVLLWKYVKEKYGNDFFFVNRFPFKKKPFYVMRADQKWARSVDLIFKGFELSSGGQREHRWKELIKNIKVKKISLKNLEWFTKFFRYAVPPHGGFNIGIERLTMALLDLPNVREAVLFPRDTERLTP